MYAWLNIAPSNYHETEDPGIQRMVTVRSGRPLRNIIDEMLMAWDAKLDGQLEDIRYNQTIPIVTRGTGLDTGLVLIVMPCAANGTNVDVDSNEPTGG